eukprot:TRINITY_DN7955_c0_g1_i7.p1 TRINITY_DN7955_c0_g1~~TRINITY_DN7955_c0_g1_i7.p1  ORF type:complete len:634 (+),score=86.70 TRINITY_DN7955_c0_g1_i7:273-2174(+)
MCVCVYAVCFREEHEEENAYSTGNIQNVRGRLSQSIVRWQTVRTRLVREKRVEYFNIPVRGKRRTRPCPCLRLLSDAPTSGLSKPDSEQKPKQQKVSNQVVELDANTQLLLLIESTGSEGIPQLDAWKKLNIGKKNGANRSRELKRNLGVSAVAEQLRKQMSYRMTAQIKRPPEPLIGDLAFGLSLSAPKACTGNRTALTVQTSEDRATDREKEKETRQQQPQLDTSEQVDEEDDSQPPHKKPRLDPSIPDHAEPGAQRKPRPRTVQSIQRVQFILEQLQEKRMVMAESLIAMIYENELKSNSNAVRVDSKTVRRIVQDLKVGKKVNVVTIQIPTLSGFLKKYVVLLQPPLTNTSPEVYAFIQNQREQEIKRKVIKITREPVELRKVKVAPVAYEEEKREPAEDFKTPLQIATYYGFVKPKMFRAKVFHRYLWHYVYESKAAAIAHPAGGPGFFLTHDALRSLPLSLYLRILGQMKMIPGLEEAVEQNLTVRELSLEMRRVMFSRRAYTGRLEEIMNILKVVGLVTSSPTGNALCLEKQGILPTSPKRTIPFVSGEEFDEFWDQLETIALSSPVLYEGRISFFNSRSAWRSTNPADITALSSKRRDKPVTNVRTRYADGTSIAENTKPVTMAC